MTRKTELFDVVVVTILTVWGIVIVFPFINVIALSFTSENEYLTSNYVIWPLKPTFENYKKMFENNTILIGFRTTMILEVIGMPYNLFLTICAAYALAKPSFPGKKFFLFVIVFTMYFSGGIVPTYLWLRQLGLINTIWSVILVYGVNTFYMLVMRNYIAGLPPSITESARIDGAGEWTVLLRIVLPLCKPIIATFTLFYAVDRWNEWYNSMIFIRNQELVPLQLALRNIVMNADYAMQGTLAISRSSQALFSKGIKMAAVIITIVPIVIVYPTLQRYFVKGITIGAVKS